MMEFIGTFFLCFTVATAASLSKLAPLVSWLPAAPPAFRSAATIA